MNINAYLRQISSNLIIKDEEKEHIKTSIEIFKTRIKHYFSSIEIFKILEVNIFGSYHRDTNLPRKIDDESDVDIMVVVEDDGSTPQTYLNRIKRAVEFYYSTSEIKQSTPTIVLDMKHIKFEITPAKKVFGVYYIKEKDNWIPTFALTDFDNLTIANKNNGFDIKPIIRLVKYWNVKVDNKYCSSYQIEQKIVNTFLSGAYSMYDFKDKLLVAFQSIKNLDMVDVPKVIDKIEEAIADEEKYPTISANEIKDVIKEL